MNDPLNNDIWYGELRTAKGNVIIIRDQQLPPADKGRIYLYNTERNAIIQYDESIVTPKLFPLDEEQFNQAKSQHKKAWEAARQQFMRSHNKSFSNKTETAQDSAAKVAIKEEDDEDNDDFDDDDVFD